MICPCGGLAPARDYYPEGKDIKQTTYTCVSCGRCRVEIRDLEGNLLMEKG